MAVPAGDLAPGVFNHPVLPRRLGAQEVDTQPLVRRQASQLHLALGCPCRAALIQHVSAGEEIRRHQGGDQLAMPLNTHGRVRRPAQDFAEVLLGIGSGHVVHRLILDKIRLFGQYWPLTSSAPPDRGHMRGPMALPFDRH